MNRIFALRGCPGGGKTTTLARYSNAYCDTYGPANVAIASLTRTAATEIAGRDTRVPDQNIATLHGHAYRALECTRDEMAETRPRMREFAAEHPEHAGEESSAGDPLEDAPAETTGLHAAVMNQRARLAPLHAWTQDERDYWAAWTTFKQRHALLDFTDLIERVADDPSLMPHADALLLDESQDFSALELRLALNWSHETQTTVLCADPDQVIYGWRGADPIALQDLPVQGERLLTQSYRCGRAVRDLALDWIGQIPGRRDLPWQPTDDQGSVTDAPFALRDTPDMLDQIEALDGSVMVLTTCGYMLDPLLAALRDAGVPYGNQYRRKETRWNPLRGNVAHGLAAYLRTAPGVWGTATGPRTWGHLHAWCQLIAAKGNLARGAKASIEEHCRTDEYGQNRSSEPVPLGVLIDLLGGPAHPALRNDTGWLTGALLAKHTRAGAYAARVYERDPGALLREPRLTTGTVHSVKGSSCDHVLICPELSKEAFFGEHGWHGNGQDAIRRLLYVAITRARYTATVLEPAQHECAPLDVRTYARRAAA